MAMKKGSTEQHESNGIATPPNGSVNVDPTAPVRAHKATYSTDKRKGGYLVRVEGPHAEKFVGRDVPVTRRSGQESVEHLERLIWTGTDEDSGKPVALYAFIQKPRADDEYTF